MNELKLATITSTIIEMGDKTLKNEIVKQIEKIISNELKKTTELELFMRSYHKIISRVSERAFSIKTKLQNVLEAMKNLLDQFSIFFAKEIVSYRSDELNELKNQFQQQSDLLNEKRKALVVDMNTNMVELMDRTVENLERYKKLLTVLQIRSDYKSIINKLLNTFNQLKTNTRQKLVTMNTALLEKINKRIGEYYNISKKIEHKLNLLYVKHNISNEGKQLLEKMVIKGEKIPFKKFIQYKDELKFLIDNGQLYVRV